MQMSLEHRKEHMELGYWNPVIIVRALYRFLVFWLRSSKGFVKIRLEYINDYHPFSSGSPSTAELQLLCLDCVILPDLNIFM